MGINDYSENPRADGYRGIRVWVKVEGKVHQKYFARGRMHEAKLYEQLMLKAHLPVPRENQVYRYQAKRYDPPKRTGIVGITMQFAAQRNCNPVRYYPGFAVTHQDKKNGKKNNNSRALN